MSKMMASKFRLPMTKRAVIGDTVTLRAVTHPGGGRRSSSDSEENWFGAASRQVGPFGESKIR